MIFPKKIANNNSINIVLSSAEFGLDIRWRKFFDILGT